MAKLLLLQSLDSHYVFFKKTTDANNIEKKAIYGDDLTRIDGLRASQVVLPIRYYSNVPIPLLQTIGRDTFIVP
jgi:hypothetical protein